MFKIIQIYVNKKKKKEKIFKKNLIYVIGVKYNPVKSKKINFWKVLNFFDKNVVFGQKTRMGVRPCHIRHIPVPEEIIGPQTKTSKV